VPVYRAADYVGAQAKNALDAIGTSPSIAATLAAGLAGCWAVNGWLLGRKRDRDGESEKSN
jgi:AAA family ATP:ADP antiporter